MKIFFKVPRLAKNCGLLFENLTQQTALPAWPWASVNSGLREAFWLLVGCEIGLRGVCDCCILLAAQWCGLAHIGGACCCC